MAQEFHFQHHKLEAKRNLSRLRISLAVIFMTAIGVSMPVFLSNASIPANTGSFEAESITNLSSTRNNTISDTRASGGAALEFYVNGTGTIDTSTPASNKITAYALGTQCSGAPQMTVKVDGVTAINVSVTATTAYAAYAANMSLASGSHTVVISFTNDSSDSTCDRNLIVDKIEFTPTPVSTPAPTPKPTVKPTIAPTVAPPVKTPVPTVVAAPPHTTAVSTPRPAGQASGSKASSQVVEDTTPTVPGDVMAMVTGGNAIITLQWKASTAGTGIRGYHIERMAAGADWTNLRDNVTELTYLDDTAAFSVRYRYRISAISQSGKVSDYSMVDATTGNFVVTSVTTSVGTFVSDDKLATAMVPAGALASEANCSVVTMPAKVGTSSVKVVAGSFTLVCKDAKGKLLKDFSQPIIWSVNLKNKLSGVSNPDAAVVDNNGAAVSIPGAIYDPKTQIIRFNQSSSSMVAVLADVKHGVPYGWIIFMILVLLGGAGFVVLLRNHQIEKYRDYLLAKYYNL